MIDNSAFNSVLVCDLVSLYFSLHFCVSCKLACFLCFLPYANTLFLFRVWNFQVKKVFIFCKEI